jgi:hypothetical protein
MHTLIALIVPVFTYVFHPVSGGELALRQLLESGPIMLKANGNSDCVLHLTPEDAFEVSDLLIDIVDDVDDGKSLQLENGTLHIYDQGQDTIEILVKTDVSCKVDLVGTDEHELVIKAFIEAAAGA